MGVPANIPPPRGEGIDQFAAFDNPHRHTDYPVFGLNNAQFVIELSGLENGVSVDRKNKGQK